MMTDAACCGHCHDIFQLALPVYIYYWHPEALGDVELTMYWDIRFLNYIIITFVLFKDMADINKQKIENLRNTVGMSKYLTNVE